MSAGWDNFITVWSLRQGSEVHRLAGHEGGPDLTDERPLRVTVVHTAADEHLVAITLQPALLGYAGRRVLPRTAGCRSRRGSRARGRL